MLEVTKLLWIYSKMEFIWKVRLMFINTCLSFYYIFDLEIIQRMSYLFG